MVEKKYQYINKQMRKIKGKYHKEFESFLNGRDVASAPPFPVSTYEELVKHIAKLSFKNRDNLLFFRGQDNDHINKVNKSTLYPIIYRGNNLKKPELDFRFEVLKHASKQLIKKCFQAKITGRDEIKLKKIYPVEYFATL